MAVVAACWAASSAAMMAVAAACWAASSAAMTAVADKKSLYVISTANSIIRIILIIILIPIFGLSGAVLSVVISNIVNSLLIVYYFSKY